jgi:hypothetical protein
MSHKIDLMRENWLNQDREIDGVQRLLCNHCGKLFDYERSDTDYCSEACWHLDNIGAFKQHIKRSLLTKGGTATFLDMEQWEWFVGVSDSSVGRYRSLLFKLDIDRTLINGGKISEFGELITG